MRSAKGSARAAGKAKPKPKPRKKKAKHFRFKDPVYGQHFIVVAGTSDAKEIIRIVNLHLKRIDKTRTKSSDLQSWFDQHWGGVLKVGPHLIIWFVPPRPGGNLLAHECVHATRHTFKARRVPFSGANEEAIAYHVGYLAGTIDNRL